MQSFYGLVSEPHEAERAGSNTPGAERQEKIEANINISISKASRAL